MASPSSPSLPGKTPLTEREWLAQKMEGFVAIESVPWKYLRERYGDRISKEEIVSLGQVCSKELNLSLFREYKRRKETMLKWFDKHWDVILPFLETKLEILERKDQLEKYKNG
jgi:hypothetical protein